MTWIDILIIAVFFGFTLFAGSLVYRWVGKPDDFYVAGRQLSPFILAATISATNFNIYNYVGYAGQSFAHGISIVWHEWTGLMGMVTVGLFVQPILRRMRLVTMPEFLERRYHLSVRLLISFVWIFRRAFSNGIAIYLCAKVAMILTGYQNFTFWVVTVGAVAIFYASTGGMWSVVLVNNLQFIFLLGAGLTIFPILLNHVGWLPGLKAQLPAASFDFVPQSGPFNWAFIMAIWFLGIQVFCTDQMALQSNFSARNPKTAVQAWVMAGIIMIPFSFLIVLPGMIGTVTLPAATDPDSVFPALLLQLIPTGVLGIALCGLLASVLSSVDTSLTAITTLFTVDFYKRLIRPAANDRQTLGTARVTSLVLGVLVVIFAHLVESQFGTAVNAYLSIIAITDMPLFVVAILGGLVWRRTTWIGALAAYFFGLAGGLTSQLLGWHIQGCSFAASTFMSFGSAIVACVVVSLVTRPPEASKVAQAMGARKVGADEIKAGTAYHLMPKHLFGKLFLGVHTIGLIAYVAGLVLGSIDFAYSDHLAIGGMVVFLVGALFRLFYD
ncbi:sodium:solute symporter [candidate division KSB1 bacterium]